MVETNASKKNGDDIFITDLTIHKVRHLKDIHIPLSKDERKHLILTGKNGSGKTSVLEWLKNYLHAIYDNPDIIKNIREFIDLEFNLNSIPNGEMLKFLASPNFIFAYYKAKREAFMQIPHGVKKIDLKNFYKIDENPGRDFLQHIVNLKADKSFARDDNDHETVKNIETWFEMFEKSLKEIFEDKFLRLEFDRQNYDFNIIQKGKEPFGFNTLADGYSAIINMVTDLMLRMEKNKTKSYNVQGVVLIDELEAHLHLDLQKKIFPFLIRFFPRIQFIVSTHSPFVLSSIENAVIYDLEKNLLVGDLSGYSYDGIVEGYFRNDKYSEIVKGNLETYERLLNMETRTEDEEEQMMDLRIELENIPDSLAPELKARFQRIELKRIK